MFVSVNVVMQVAILVLFSSILLCGRIIHVHLAIAYVDLGKDVSAADKPL
eukprot:m.57577 g.57577  ORF g.57577 m.57577 type:complete len:50 (-) comp15612_c0_seq1:713-862(-)